MLFPPTANIEHSPDHWIATQLTYDSSNRNVVSLRAIGRLNDGVTLAEAQATLERIAANLRDKSTTWKTADFHLRLAPMQAHLVREVQPTVVVLMSAAIVLLIIACANVINLFLVRTSARVRELAVRRALGAPMWRLTSPIVAEALVVAVVSGALGIALAWLSGQQLRGIAPATVTRFDVFSVNGQVMAVTIIATAVVTALISLASVWRIGRTELTDSLHAGGRTLGPTATHVRSRVVVVAVALSFVLLTGAGLMVRSFLELQRIDPQFDPTRVLTFQLLGSRGGDQPAQRAAFMAAIKASLRGIPGVQQVTASTPFPLTGNFNATRWGTEAALADPSLLQSADFKPFYWVLRNATYAAHRRPHVIDTDNLPGRNVVVIDQMLARKAFPNESALQAARGSPQFTCRSGRRRLAPARGIAGGTGTRADLLYGRIHG